ncbi:MAG: DUF6065 family protein [bacterium]|nr:DUF6065 family protein [bacterium]
MHHATPFIRLLPIPNIEYDVTEYVRPADVQRGFFQPHFYRCLPMSAANSLGWTLYNPYAFSVVWSGGDNRDDITIECDYPHWIKSWFGYGTFTIYPLFLVESSPGIDLWLRPVPNHYKLGVLPLEGIIETDWMKSGFTFSIKVMLPRMKVHYAKGEPLINLVPYPRHLVEAFRAEIVTEGEAYDARMEQYKTWLADRMAQIEQQRHSELAYLRGVDMDGSKVPDHVRTFKVPPFKHANENDDR